MKSELEGGKDQSFQTHLIAARLGTAKVNEARRHKSSAIKIVTPDWLWCCAERWEHIDERLFPLEKKTPGIAPFVGVGEGVVREQNRTILRNPAKCVLFHGVLVCVG